MLKKLLCYDFKAIFKYWWIGALTTFILAFAGAGCGSVLNSPKDLPESVYVFATIGLVLIALSFFAFAIMTALLIYIRFYKHLFSDEGYLTFTLPVKRNQLIASKLIVGSVATFLSALVSLINGGIIIFTSFRNELFYKGWFEDVKEVVIPYLETHGTFNVVFSIFEALVIAVITIILSVLFTYLCITIGAVISKKAKLASAIGIYYAASSAMTIFMYIFYFFGVDALVGWTRNLPNEQEFVIISGILLLIIFTLIMLCVVFYTLINWFVDRKLNLN